MTNKKGNVPSVRDLRDALGKAKKDVLKQNPDAQVMRYQLAVLPQSWMLASGDLGAFEPLETPEALVELCDSLEIKRSSQEQAKTVIAKLKSIINEVQDDKPEATPDPQSVSAQAP